MNLIANFGVEWIHAQVIAVRSVRRIVVVVEYCLAGGTVLGDDLDPQVIVDVPELIGSLRPIGDDESSAFSWEGSLTCRRLLIRLSSRTDCDRIRAKDDRTGDSERRPARSRRH